MGSFSARLFLFFCVARYLLNVEVSALSYGPSNSLLLDPHDPSLTGDETQALRPWTPFNFRETVHKLVLV